eukprot:4384281-Prymnesium_polylepis.2
MATRGCTRSFTSQMGPSVRARPAQADRALRGHRRRGTLICMHTHEHMRTHARARARTCAHTHAHVCAAQTGGR